MGSKYPTAQPPGFFVLGIDARRGRSDHVPMLGILALIGVSSLILNVPLGVWRSRVKKFSWRWFVAVHASVPVIAGMRIYSHVSLWTIPLFIFLAVAGQLVGGRVDRRLKAVKLGDQ